MSESETESMVSISPKVGLLRPVGPPPNSWNGTARASYEENVKGSITPGKYVDFVMLEKDPHDVNPDEIKNIRVVRTVVGGRTMHPKGETTSEE